MKALKLAAAVLASMTMAVLADSTPVVLWETTGLKTPESALPVPDAGFAYVSNVNGAPTEKDGNGFISKVGLKDGKVIALDWVKGLNAPKGMALNGDRLYVSDIDQLAEIDTNSGEVLKRYDAADAKFLNDVTTDDEGRVYVSDMMTNKIWRLADGKFEVWLDSPKLKNPNGLKVVGDKMIVAAWGPSDAEGTPAPANLLEVTLEDKSVRDLGDGSPVGNLDGLEPLDESSFLVTDWMAGGLFRIDATGKAEQLLDLNQGSADIGYVPAERLLLIPMMKDDKLVAYRLE
jgi:hypothetical protein